MGFAKASCIYISDTHDNLSVGAFTIPVNFNVKANRQPMPFLNPWHETPADGTKSDQLRCDLSRCRGKSVRELYLFGKIKPFWLQQMVNVPSC